MTGFYLDDTPLNRKTILFRANFLTSFWTPFIASEVNESGNKMTMAGKKGCS